MFLPENIIEQGQLEGKLKEESLEDYQYILKRIGITENDIRTKIFHQTKNLIFSLKQCLDMLIRQVYQFLKKLNLNKKHLN